MTYREKIVLTYGCSILAIITFWTIKTDIFGVDPLLVMATETLNLAVDSDTKRFFPLTNQFVFNAVEWLGLLGIPAHKILAITFLIAYISYLSPTNCDGSKKPFLRYLAVIVLSPTLFLNFSTTYNSETDLVITLVVTSISFIEYHRSEKLIWFILFFIGLFFSLFLKETIFSSLIPTLIIYFLVSKPNYKILAVITALLVMFATTYYYFIISPESGTQNIYGINWKFDIWHRVRIFAHYVIDNLSVIILLVLLFRQIISSRNLELTSSPEMILLVWGVSYIASYIALGMYALNYALPAYILILPSLIKYLTLNNRQWIYIHLSVVAIFPLSANVVSQTVSHPRNFVASMDHIHSLSNSKGLDHVNIFISGTKRMATNKDPGDRQDRSIAMNVYFFYSSNYPNAQFDVLSDEVAERNFPKNGYPNYPIKFYKDFEPSIPKDSDIILIPPHSSRNRLKLIEKYQGLGFEIQENKQPIDYDFQNYSIKSAIKLLINLSEVDIEINDQNIMRSNRYFILAK